MPSNADTARPSSCVTTHARLINVSYHPSLTLYWYIVKYNTGLITCFKLVDAAICFPLWCPVMHRLWARDFVVLVEGDQPGPPVTAAVAAVLEMNVLECKMREQWSGDCRRVARVRCPPPTKVTMNCLREAIVPLALPMPFTRCLNLNII